jgi:DNA-binding PadR family transcriptional regulator
VFNRNDGHRPRAGGSGHHGRQRGLGSGRGLRGGRMASAADLQLMIAAFLFEQPSHGYEIIKAVQERSNGYYTPSAGMVYPSLTYLEEIGYANVAAEGSRKLYSLTDAGKTYVEQNRSRVTALFSELTRVGQKMQRAQRAYEAESGAQTAGLDEVRRDLKAALFDAIDASPAEQSRIAEILSRALAEINRR